MERLREKGYEDIGCARLDYDRQERTGFAEAVFCQGKTPEQCAAIIEKLYQKNGRVLATRASREQYEAAADRIPAVSYDEPARVITAGGKPQGQGLIAICTAGTADIPVALEAKYSAEFGGANTECFFDVGVAGIHRLLDNISSIRKANAVIAVAGMEGALPSVIAGLVSVPVIAVPTSVGYGANLGGISALLCMLNSCAGGVAVVNIDNGFGAGVLAAQINRLAAGGPSGN